MTYSEPSSACSNTISRCGRKAAKQSKLDNSSSSLLPTLSEVETADIDSFLQDMLSIFPLLNLNVFEKADTGSSSKRGQTLFINAKGVSASGYEGAKVFVLVAGSEMFHWETQSIHQYISTFQKDLIEQAVVQSQGDQNLFMEDYVFSSPSAAVGVILGRSTNGREDWKTAQGVTLK